MASILVIDDDEWILELLASAIRDAGYVVETVTTATDGIDAARRLQPDCVVCDLDLPDRDGFWVARMVRAESARVAVSPFLFLSKHDEPRIRAQGFEVGADVFMTKPFHVDEVLAQVRALVAMAERLQRSQAPLEPFSAIDGSHIDKGAAIEGAIGQVSIASLLTVFEMEQRTGSFEVSGAHHTKLELASGQAVDASIDGAPTPPIEAVRAMLAVDSGHFTLWPRPASTAPPGSQPIGELLVRARGPAAAPTSVAAPIAGEAATEQRSARSGSTKRSGKARGRASNKPAPRSKSAAGRPDTEDAIEVEVDLTSYRPPNTTPK